MSNYQNTKATIAANVYTNHNNEVTAAMVKAGINAVVDTLIAGGFLYKGVATTSTNPGSPDANVFYIATAPGTYTNFGSLVVTDGEVAILKYNGSWSKEVTGAATAAQVSALGHKVLEIMGMAANSTMAGVTGVGDIFYNTSTKVLKKCTIWGGTPGTSTYVDIPFVVGNLYRFHGMLYFWNGSDLVPTNNLYFAYLVGGASPTFTKSGSSVIVSFPYNLRIYKENGGALNDNIAVSGQTYTIANLQKLVYDFADKSVKVVNSDVLGDYVLLLANSTGAYLGLLAPYYTTAVDGRVATNTDAIKKAEPIAYLAGPQFIDFSIIQAGGNVVSIKVDFFSALTIYSKNGESLVSYNMNGQSYTLTNTQKLVYNLATNSVAVVANNAVGNYYVLLTNDGGTIDGLLAKYIYKTNNDAAMSQVVTLASNTQYRAFVKECFLYGNIDKTKTYRVQLLYRNYNGNWGVRIADSSGTNVCSWFGTSEDCGILPLAEISSSGIFGFIIVNWEYGRTSSDANIVFSERVFYPEYSPAICSYIRSRGNNVEQTYNTKEMLSKLQNLKRANTSGGKPTLTLLHLSDIHADAENVRRAIELRALFSSYVTDMLNTGDSVREYYTDGISGLASVPGWENILTAIGNHDTSGELVNGVRDWSEYAGADAYARYIGPYISNWGVAHDGNTSHCYYYKDYTTAGFRLIVLDNMVMPTDSTHYDSNQISWFESTLASAKTAGLAVICAWHYPGQLVKNTDSGFCSIDISGTGGDGMDVFISAVDTFISGGGEFVCWLAGHQHADLLGVLNGHTNQSVIAIACTWPYNNTGDMQRDANTKNRDCLNFIAFDKNVKIVKIVRAGADYDRYLRHKGVLCWDYDAKQLIFTE